MAADDEVMSNEADDDKDGENEVDENDEAVDDVTSDDNIEEVTDGVANGDNIEGVTDKVVDDADSIGITVEGVSDGNIEEFSVNEDGEVIDIIEKVDGVGDVVPDDKDNEVAIGETDGVENNTVTSGRPNESILVEDVTMSVVAIVLQLSEQSFTFCSKSILKEDGTLSVVVQFSVQLSLLKPV